MRYLKSFNEGFKDVEEKKRQLQDYCDGYLAYLYDEGFRVNITDSKGYGMYLEIMIIKKVDTNRIKFSFDEVKDYFISFYQMLQQDYDLVDWFGGKANVEAYIEVYTSMSEHYISDYELESDYLNEILGLLGRIKDILSINIKVKI
jgi:hypothetical protein